MAGRSTSQEVQARVEEVLRIRLDGAELWDVRQYASEKGWGVSDRQLRRYIAAAAEMIAEAACVDRAALVSLHLAKRRALYARAVQAGELRTALSCAQDEAQLLGLYPAQKHEVAGQGGGAVLVTVIEAVRPAQALIETEQHDDGDRDAAGPGGDHA